VSWNVALAVGSLVLLAGGVASMVKRTMRPSQAISILVVAVGVAAVAAIATSIAGEGAGGALFTAVIVLTCAVGGAAMAVAIVLRKPDRLR
jgi:hypothetical protein